MNIIIKFIGQRRYATIFLCLIFSGIATVPITWIIESEFISFGTMPTLSAPKSETTNEAATASGSQAPHPLPHITDRKNTEIQPPPDELEKQAVRENFAKQQKGAVEASRPAGAASQHTEVEAIRRPKPARVASLPEPPPVPTPDPIDSKLQTLIDEAISQAEINKRQKEFRRIELTQAAENMWQASGDKQRRLQIEKQSQADHGRNAPSPQSSLRVASSDTEPEQKLSQNQDNEKNSHKSGRVLTERIIELGKTVQSLPLGKIVMLAPEKMKVGDTSKIDVKVTNKDNVIKIDERTRQAKQIVEGELRISPEMIAQLSGPEFKITPITTEKQNIAYGFTTVWSWNVEALSDGNKELEATLYALVPNANKETLLRIDSYNQSVTVSVRPLTWGEWFKSLAEDLKNANALLATIGAMIAAVLGYFGLSIQFKKRDAAKPASKNPRKTRQATVSR